MALSGCVAGYDTIVGVVFLVGECGGGWGLSRVGGVGVGAAAWGEGCSPKKYIFSYKFCNFKARPDSCVPNPLSVAPQDQTDIWFAPSKGMSI